MSNTSVAPSAVSSDIEKYHPKFPCCLEYEIAACAYYQTW